MHPEFPDWYREAGVTPSPESIEARWKGVEDAARIATRKVSAGLLRLALLPGSLESVCPPEVRTAFRSHDPTFPENGNLQEMRVLAGATLRTMFDANRPAAKVAALGLLSGAFDSQVERAINPRHVDAAAQFCARTAQSDRAREKRGTLEVPEMTQERFMEFYQAAVSQNNVAAAAEPIRAALNDSLSSLTEAVEEAIQALEQEVRSKDEEIDYLWWLMAQHSKLTNQPFKEVGALVGAIVYPLELADLTAGCPGPPAVIAVMMQALLISGADSSAQPVALHEAINAVPRELRESRRNTDALDEAIGPICPTMLAVKCSLMTHGPVDWLPVFGASCDIPGEIELPVGVLSKQVFNEQMFLRAFKDLRK